MISGSTCAFAFTQTHPIALGTGRLGEPSNQRYVALIEPQVLFIAGVAQPPGCHITVF